MEHERTWEGSGYIVQIMQIMWTTVGPNTADLGIANNDTDSGMHAELEAQDDEETELIITKMKSTVDAKIN